MLFDWVHVVVPHVSEAGRPCDTIFLPLVRHDRAPYSMSTSSDGTAGFVDPHPT